MLSSLAKPQNKCSDITETGKNIIEYCWSFTSQTYVFDLLFLHGKNKAYEVNQVMTQIRPIADEVVATEQE